MNVLSCFDGVSCGRIALERAGVEVDNYFSSEIDKYAIQVANKNYPQDIANRLGDVTKVNSKDLPQIDLLIGGSPCQSFSRAGDGSGFDGKSKLFFEYVRLLKETNPKYFLLENVLMKKEWEDIITNHLGVEPVMIDSALFSAQQRKRLYWTNIPINKIENINNSVIADVLGIDIVNKRENKILMSKSDVQVRVRKYYINTFELGVYLKEHKQKSNKTTKEISNYLDIPLTKVEHYFRLDKSFAIPDVEYWFKLKECLNIESNKFDKQITEFEIKSCSYDMAKRIYHIDGKHPTLTTLTGGGKRKTITDGTDMFKLMPIHCERLQTVPDNYTEGVSNNQRYKILGNGWTVDVVAHIFKGLK